MGVLIALRIDEVRKNGTLFQISLILIANTVTQRVAIQLSTLARHSMVIF